MLGAAVWCLAHGVKTLSRVARETACAYGISQNKKRMPNYAFLVYHTRTRVQLWPEKICLDTRSGIVLKNPDLVTLHDEKKPSARERVKHASTSVA